MKILFSFFLTCFLFLGAQAQECEAYSPLTEDTFIELTQYTAKGKVTGRTEHLVLSGNGTEGTIKATVYDKKDNLAFSTDYTVECKDGGFYVEMANYLSTTGLPEGSNFDFEMDGDFLKFPSGMQAGDVLDEGEILAEVKSNGTTIVRLGFTLMNRKVEAIETITTSAGSFECVKISFDFSSKIGFVNVKGSAIEWVSEDIGVVRSESYNKKGKLTDYMEITKYVK